MKKMTKWLLIGFLAILVCSIIAVSTLPLVLNPNDFKPDITRLIKEKSGLDVVFDGDLKLSMFPWIGVTTGKLLINGKSGLNNPSLMTIDNCDIKVKLLPLLKQKLEVNTVTLDGLKLNLLKDKQGVNNWADLFAVTPPAPVAGANAIPNNQNAAPQPILAALTVGGFNIHNAEISWQDQQSGQHLELKNLQLTADKFAFGEPVNMNLAMTVSGNVIKFPGSVSNTVTLRVDEQLNNFEFKDSHWQWNGINTATSGQTLALNINVPFTKLDVKQQTLESSGLQVETGDIKLDVTIKAEHILEHPGFSGSAITQPFNPSKVMQNWGITPPVMRDVTALTNLAMSFQFKGNANQIDFTSVDATLDNSHITGLGTIKNLKQPQFVFDLAADNFDVDSYLKPREKRAFTSPGMALAAGSFSMSLEWLKQLDAEGKLLVGAMALNGMQLQDVQLTLSSKKGSLKIDQTAKHFFEGSYSGNLHIDANASKLTLDEEFTNIHLEPLLKVIRGETKIDAIATVSSQLQGKGSNLQDLQASLSGEFNFFLKDGFIRGFDLEKILANSKSLVKGGKFSVDPQHDQTAFSELSGTATIDKGILHNDDLSAKTATLRSAGKGNINFKSGQLDYRLISKLVKTAATATTPEQLHDTPIGIHLGGTLSKPTYTLDVAALLTDKNRDKIEHFLDKNKDKIDKVLNKLDKKLGPGGASELLKKFF